MAVLAAHADADGEPTGRDLCQRGDLARRHHRMTQRQEHHTDLEVESRFEARDRREVRQPVDAVAAHEADVVRGEQVVDTAVCDGGHAGPLLFGLEIPQVPRSADPDLDTHGEKYCHASELRSSAESSVRVHPIAALMALALTSGLRSSAG